MRGDGRLCLPFVLLLASEQHLAPSDVIWTSSPPGGTSTSLQPALIVDDRRLRAVLDLEFGALCNWNIQTGAIEVRRLTVTRCLGLPSLGAGSKGERSLRPGRRLTR
jgi:hypothetical protein